MATQRNTNRSVDSVRLVFESRSPGDGAALSRFGDVITILPEGGIDGYLTRGKAVPVRLITLRAVTPRAFEVRGGIDVLQGRSFTPGLDEDGKCAECEAMGGIWKDGTDGGEVLEAYYPYDGYPYIFDDGSVNDGTHRYGLELEGLLSGEYYTFIDAPADPKPVQSPLPILVGTGGPRMCLSIARRCALRCESCSRSWRASASWALRLPTTPRLFSAVILSSGVPFSRAFSISWLSRSRASFSCRASSRLVSANCSAWFCSASTPPAVWIRPWVSRKSCSARSASSMSARIWGRLAPHPLSKVT